MRTIPGLIKTNPPIRRSWDNPYFQHALAGCLAYTKDIEALNEMLDYVLLGSRAIADIMNLHHRLFEVIDIMVETVGPDFEERDRGSGVGGLKTES